LASPSGCPSADVLLTSISLVMGNFDHSVQQVLLHVDLLAEKVVGGVVLV
jgi:hypothetical protein